MGSNSLDSIVERMKQGSITERWGAVCAFDDARLNRVLRQQWLEKYDGSNYTPVFSGKMNLSESGTEQGELTNILLGKPLLSFKPARMDNSRALLTLSILGGTFTASIAGGGVLYSYSITEAQGYTLEVELDLSVVVGVVDRLGRVVLDLTKGTTFSCNLAAPAASQKMIGAFFQERFKALPANRQVYELGMLNLKGGGDLTPEHFIILTQRAPAALTRDTLNEGEGAVVVMIKLRGNAMGGDIPSPERFPYLIPDDEKDGVRLYSATMVLNKDFVSRTSVEKESLITSLLFPGQKNVFVELERKTLHDMVVFGSLDPSRTSMTIEPGVHSLKAGGKPLQYTAYLNNAVQNGVAWSVKSLNTNNSAGVIDERTGIYTPVSAAQIGSESVRNIVTATWFDPFSQQQLRASALLLVTPEAMSISPSFVPRRVAGAPVTFVATALSGSILTWTAPRYGTLVPNGNTAVYTPPADLDQLQEQFVVQPIEVKDQDGETVRASVLLTKFAPTLDIDPPFVSNLARSGTVQLSTTESGIPPDAEYQWKVVDGGGSVTDGAYTAPAAPLSPFSVVKCDIYFMGVLIRSGYSVIKLSEIDPEPAWSAISKFSLSSLRTKTTYNNGYQQIPVQAEIETVGGRLNEDEKNSLLIYYVGINQQIPVVPDGQQGIVFDPEFPVYWAQTRDKNIYNPYTGSSAVASTVEPAADPLAEDPQTILVYVVSRAVEVQQFYAVLWDRFGVPSSSLVYPGHEDGKISLVPQVSPTNTDTNYTLTRRRVDGNGGSDDSNDDDFDLYLKTTDYWTLTYQQSGNKSLTFKTLDTPRHKSIVKWESIHYNETMFSYTGVAFNDPTKKNNPVVMQYDDRVSGTIDTKSTLISTPAEGHIFIGLFRTDNVRQDEHGSLVPLQAPEAVHLKMTDEEGHAHSIKISFKAGDRNRLDVERV